MSGIHFVLVKGASHQVPQSKRPESLYIYKTLLDSYPGKPILFEWVSIADHVYCIVYSVYNFFTLIEKYD